jgi:hypothetical protein
VQRLFEARRHLATRIVGNQRNAFTRLDRQTHVHGVVRTGHELGGDRTIQHQLQL